MDCCEPAWWTPDVPNTPPPQYSRLAEWPGVVVPTDEVCDLEDGVMRIAGLKHNVKHLASVPMPIMGRGNVFFWVHDDDVAQFEAARSKLGARWWSDVPEDEKGSHPKLFREAFVWRGLSKILEPVDHCSVLFTKRVTKTSREGV